VPAKAAVSDYGFAIVRPPTEHANSLMESIVNWTVTVTLASWSGSYACVVGLSRLCCLGSRPTSLYLPSWTLGTNRLTSRPLGTETLLLLFLKLRFGVRSVG
jgi:hypothetical protein